MKLNIQAINFDATDKLHAHIEKKAKKLTRLSDEIMNVDVILKVIKPETVANKRAEIKVFVPQADFFVSKTNDSFEEAIDLGLDAIERQIKKHKQKFIKK